MCVQFQAQLSCYSLIITKLNLVAKHLNQRFSSTWQSMCETTLPILWRMPRNSTSSKMTGISECPGQGIPKWRWHVGSNRSAILPGKSSISLTSSALFGWDQNPWKSNCTAVVGHVCPSLYGINIYFICGDKFSRFSWYTL